MHELNWSDSSIIIQKKLSLYSPNLLLQPTPSHFIYSFIFSDAIGVFHLMSIPDDTNGIFCSFWLIKKGRDAALNKRTGVA